MTRLIDADTLKKAYFNAIEKSSIGEVSIVNLIDNAPTVENITIFAELGEDMADITREIMPQLLAKVRPQGEWNYIQAGMAVCPFCGATPHKQYKNFCPNCGADMRGKEE